MSNRAIILCFSLLLLACNKVTKGGKVRLAVFRSGSGSYKPETNLPMFVIEAHKLDINEYVINEKGLTVDVFNDIQKHQSVLSSLKTSNSLSSTMALVKICNAISGLPHGP